MEQVYIQRTAVTKKAVAVRVFVINELVSSSHVAHSVWYLQIFEIKKVHENDITYLKQTQKCFSQWMTFVKSEMSPLQ